MTRSDNSPGSGVPIVSGWRRSPSTSQVTPARISSMVKHRENRGKVHRNDRRRARIAIGRLPTAQPVAGAARRALVQIVSLRITVAGGPSFVCTYQGSDTSVHANHGMQDTALAAREERRGSERPSYLSISLRQDVWNRRAAARLLAARQPGCGQPSRRVLWNDPASGVMRHSDAGYPRRSPAHGNTASIYPW
jgi:hypothetical protein